MKNMKERLEIHMINLYVELCSTKHYDDIDGFEEIHKFFVENDLLKWIDTEKFEEMNPLYHSRLIQLKRDMRLTELLENIID